MTLLSSSSSSSSRYHILCFRFFVQLSYLRVFRDVKVWESRAGGKPQSSESTDVDCFGLTAGLWRCSGTNHTLRLTNWYQNITCFYARATHFNTHLKWTNIYQIQTRGSPLTWQLPSWYCFSLKIEEQSECLLTSFLGLYLASLLNVFEEAWQDRGGSGEDLPHLQWPPSHKHSQDGIFWKKWHTC